MQNSEPGETLADAERQQPRVIFSGQLYVQSTLGTYLL